MSFHFFAFCKHCIGVCLYLFIYLCNMCDNYIALKKREASVIKTSLTLARPSCIFAQLNYTNSATKDAGNVIKSL